MSTVDDDLFSLSTHGQRQQYHHRSADSSPNVEAQLHRHSQSNPQLNSSSSTLLGISSLASAKAPVQRHSTGSLALVDAEKPKKGILKRPHTFNTGRQQQRVPLSNRKEKERKAAEEAPSAKAAQHVEFAEKKAVFGETITDTEVGGESTSATLNNKIPSRKNTTAIVSPVIRNPQQLIAQQRLHFEPDRSPSEEGSESSKSGVSHIVGKWWFGKSTKFVVHCDRRGCSGHSSRENTPAGEEQHQHHPDEPYLTPTQRKQREISALKKELRRAQLSCREKERHLGQLKERMDEIEQLMASSSSAQMVQCAQLRQQLIEREEEFATETEALVARHEHRMRQLNQELTDLRIELARKNMILAEKEQIERRDRAVQVDELQQNSHSPAAPLSPSLVPATALGWTPSIKQKFEYSEDVPFGGEEKKPSEPQAQLLLGASKSAPVSPSKDPTVRVGAEVLATLEAYRSETVVWRTRTAQLELILQDLLLREGARAATRVGDGTSATREEADQRIADAHPQLADDEPKELTQQQRKMTVSAAAGSEAPSGECQQAACMERQIRWVEEQTQLNQKATDLERQLNELRMKNTETEGEMDRLDTQLSNLKMEHAELAELAESRLCEIKAIQMTLQGIRAERDKLEQAMAYIERRCHVMEQIGLDQGIVLIEIDDFQRAPGDVFTFRGSKATQTILTADAVGCNERELDELQIRIRAMQITFAENKAQMSEQLKEIEHFLNLKTSLVAKLTDQLENAAKSSRAEDEHHQQERDAFTKRVEELGRVAERVPILETELERVRSEKSHCELKLKRTEEAADERMESALERALHKTKLTEEYWAEKFNSVERKCAELAILLEHERKVAAAEQIRWEMQQVELDHRLQSAIEHASMLNSRLNCPRRDAQCEVRPRTANKYVVCRPNQHDKAIGAELRDAELDELKEELNTLEAERQWMQTELSRMEREMADRIRERTLKRKSQKRLPELTVSFHRGSEIVELGGHFSGSHTLDIQRGGIGASILSLPAVLDSTTNSSVDGLRPFSRVQRIQRSTTPTTENEMSAPHELSLPVLTVNGRQQTARCHSAPRRQEVRGSMAPQEIIVGTENVPEVVEQHAELREQIRVLHERIQELLAASERRGSSEGVQREAKLDELFMELESWLQATADGERNRIELQRRMHTVQRERDQLREQLRDAFAELEVYRTEPRREAWEQAVLDGKRSSSAEQLDHGGAPPLGVRQLRRWKEIAGTTFREVNQLRKRLMHAEDERLSQRNQLAILRGELTMTKCLQRHHGVGGSSSFLRKRGRRGSVGRELSPKAIGGEGEDEGTLASYNRWLGGDRWQSVPELDEADQQQVATKRRKQRDSAKEAIIVQEALKKQLALMKQRFVLMESQKQEEIEGKDYTLKKVEAECGLLRRENMMYEQKCVDMDRERQQMYLIMFRKGQQAANMKMEEEEEVDKASELQVVLHFLHDAFFYYLLNKGSAREHLQAIMTMLSFTPEQKEQVYKRRGKSH